MNSTQMNSIETSIFLNDGAFIRWQGQWFVFQGPFLEAEFKNNLDFSICYMHFYGDNSHAQLASKSVTMNPSQWAELVKSETHSHFRKWKGPKRELYTQSFNLVKQQIELRRWQKAVPIAFDESTGGLSTTEKLAILHSLTQVPDSLIPYGFWTQGKGFIGASPEILYYKKENHVESMALAGTQKKSGEPSNLLRDQKNRSEHQFVVDELIKQWKGFGKVYTSPTEILELPSLFHLLTKFKVDLQNSVTDRDLVQSLHPTSAVGVFPHELWRELSELPEQKTRDYFAAPVVYSLSSTESVAVVGLRQIQWDLDRVRIGAGGGVVDNSQEQLEWQEILAKIESVKKILKV